MSTIKNVLSAAAILAATTVGAAAEPVLEPTTQKFIDALAGGKPIYTLSPADARDVLAGAQKIEVKKLPASHREQGDQGWPDRQRQVAHRSPGKRQGHASGYPVLPRRRLGPRRCRHPRSAGP